MSFLLMAFWPIILAVGGFALMLSRLLPVSPVLLRILAAAGFILIGLGCQGATRADGPDLYLLGVGVAVLGGAGVGAIFLPAKALDHDGDEQANGWERWRALGGGALVGGLICATVLFSGKVPRPYWFGAGAAAGALGWGLGGLAGFLNYKVSKSKSIPDAFNILRRQDKPED